MAYLTTVLAEVKLIFICVIIRMQIEFAASCKKAPLKDEFINFIELQEL